MLVNHHRVSTKLQQTYFVLCYKEKTIPGYFNRRGWCKKVFFTKETHFMVTYLQMFLSVKDTLSLPVTTSKAYNTFCVIVQTINILNTFIC